MCKSSLIKLINKFIVVEPESRLTNIYTSLHLIGPFNRSLKGQSENDDYLQLTPANTNPHFIYKIMMIETSKL